MKEEDSQAEVGSRGTDRDRQTDRQIDSLYIPLTLNVTGLTGLHPYGSVLWIKTIATGILHKLYQLN